MLEHGELWRHRKEVSHKEQILCDPVCTAPAQNLNVIKFERGVFLILVGSKGLDTFSY